MEYREYLGGSFFQKWIHYEDMKTFSTLKIKIFTKRL